MSVRCNKPGPLSVNAPVFNFQKKQPFTDILFNVLLPLIIGLLLYHTRSIFPLKGFMINQLPDGCWAYAFMSCILIIWDRRINQFWIWLAFIIAVFFEVLQSLQFIAGTGDAWDIFTYFLATMLVLICNKSFKRKFIPPFIPTKSSL